MKSKNMAALPYNCHEIIFQPTHNLEVIQTDTS